MQGNRPALSNPFSGGTEWLIDAQGCSVERLTDPVVLRALCDQVLADLQLNIVAEPIFHRFGGPGGVTGMYLLSESHLTCHTYPEVGFATFNLYCCRQRRAWPWDQALRDALGAADVCVRKVDRQVIHTAQDDKPQDGQLTGHRSVTAGGCSK
ncbi:S-adenosylmethionine decarboxylase [Stieleria sp. JC731]|uniref:S-adenosylmethionine decarboxylase family protein n=1 Tax=Pirellulaceae TaxID=2691357 RepID=UPI001E5B5ACF|nr:S-adenosylmethionine decarboxylase [Stieleria sp. JC731]MCC9600566.1 S-adenosylmethionine decarboxylase [Stieleria sp. JC731]